MADKGTTSNRVHFSSAGADCRRPSPQPRLLPLAQPIGSGWMPVIYHPTRIAEYLRFERFPRKAKVTGAEAMAYAERVVWYRECRAAEKRRRIEALSHPRFTYVGRAA
jgi:hypothetical protein